MASWKIYIKSNTRITAATIVRIAAAITKITAKAISSIKSNYAISDNLVWIETQTHQQHTKELQHSWVQIVFPWIHLPVGYTLSKEIISSEIKSQFSILSRHVWAVLLSTTFKQTFTIHQIGDKFTIWHGFAWSRWFKFFRRCNWWSQLYACRGYLESSMCVSPLA